MPGTIANRNATRHGLRAGQLPKGAAYIRRDTEAFRRVLEDAVAATHAGEVSIYHAALIQTAVRWERHAMLTQRWLRLEAEQMDHAQRLAYSRDIARASAERDKCLAALKLDADRHVDPFDLLDSIGIDDHTQPADEPEGNPPHNNACSEPESPQTTLAVSEHHPGPEHAAEAPETDVTCGEFPNA